MNCQSFAEIVSELARDRDTDQIETTLRVNAVKHTDECGECALRLQDQRALTRSLQVVAEDMKLLAAPSQVETRLLSAFHQTLASPGPNPSAELRPAVFANRTWASAGRSNRWLVAAAAAVLIVLGIAGLRGYLRRQSLPLGTTNAVALKGADEFPATAGVRDSVTPKKQDSQKLNRRANFQRRPRSLNRDGNGGHQVVSATPFANDNDTVSEVATNFMPLGYVGPINPQDGGQLVRVELSRSAMLTLGLPVNMDRYSERVKADVLLGADGLARAIRFVQ